MSRIAVYTQNLMSTSLVMVLPELFPMRIFSPCPENSFFPVPTQLFHLARRMALIPWPVLLWYRHKPSPFCGLLLRDSSPTNLKSNLKRFWSVLKVKSKHKNVPETITMATSDSSRVKASTPSEVADSFNQYFASVFTSDHWTPASERENGQLPDSDPFLTDVILSVSEVELILLNLDASKATGPDEITCQKFWKKQLTW